ncbi:hypothetical protein [Candidatus Palauibacter sp.]|uniref:hypothetical protein n=1 Tax=Candidatus Palauibacter sp. TaxID=3101350 RepID=UPI003B5B7628
MTSRILMLASALAACGGGTGLTDDIQVQIRDSAGVRIVEYAGESDIEAPFALAAEPLYRHGANPGDYEFEQINFGRLFPDGGAVLSDEWSSELVVLNPDGTTHEVLAGRGEGPGEVGFVDALFAPGRDSVLVADRRLGRVTLFAGRSIARAAELHRSIGLRVAGIGSSGELLLATSVLLTAPSFRTGFEGEWRPGHMARFDMETAALDTIASYDFVPRIPPELEWWDPIEAVGQVLFANGRFVYTRSDRPEVTWRLPDGTVTQIVRWQAEPAHLTEELVESVEAAQRRRTRAEYRSVSEARFEEILEEDMGTYSASVGRAMPLFGFPFADGEGRVWLPSYRPGGFLEDASPYTVISSDGEWLGQVEAPPGFRILDVTSEFVLGVFRDEMDVESVVVYALVERSSIPAQPSRR